MEKLCKNRSFKINFKAVLNVKPYNYLSQNGGEMMNYYECRNFGIKYKVFLYIDTKEYFEKYFEIHEVYYKGDGEIWGWSENPMSIYFENFKEVGHLVKQIRAATRKPVLRLVKGEDGEEELVPTMKTLKEYKKVDLSNWCSEDFWKEIEETENETGRE